MKNLLKALLLTLTAAITFHAQTVEPQQEARDAARLEINEGARAYKAGDFDIAQRHFEKALELDLASKNVPFFIARTIHAQFRPGVETPENIAKAREAISAYQRVLIREPNNDEAYNAIIYLYRTIKEDALENQWLMQRAINDQVPSDKRAHAFTVLASKDWNCSYNFTEQKASKTIVVQNRKQVIQYVKPADTNEYLTAQQCLTRGLELIEKAISLDSDSTPAWSYKANLLLEAVKFAEMEQNLRLRSSYEQQADETSRRVKELSDREREKKEAEDKKLKAIEEVNRPPH